MPWFMGDAEWSCSTELAGGCLRLDVRPFNLRCPAADFPGSCAARTCVAGKLRSSEECSATSIRGSLTLRTVARATEWYLRCLAAMATPNGAARPSWPPQERAL